MTQNDQALDGCIEEYVKRFRTYDRAVDVVSAFQALFLQTDPLKTTVSHFERFPRIHVEGSDSDHTPDFTVLFHDGTSLIGEIARVALHDNSVEKLCSQLKAYDAASRIPSSPSSLAPVGRSDVLLLVPVDVGPDAAQRILQRLDDGAHSYSPSVAPCIVQFMFDEGRYVFQRILIDGNGIPDDGHRADGLGGWFSKSPSIKVKPDYFAGVKSESPLMNDAPDRLYMATLMWTKIFPTLSTPRGGLSLLEVDPVDLAESIKGQFGGVRARDIKGALGLMESAGLAERLETGMWRIGWQYVRRVAERDVARVIASRACKPITGATSVERVTEALGIKTDTAQPLRLFAIDD